MNPSVAFSATGTIQAHVVETAGTYAIEAAGAQAGASAERAGPKGARISGMFYLRAGERLKIVVGRMGAPAQPPQQSLAGSGGSSLVWSGSSDLPQPIKLMLSARGGRADPAAPHATAANDAAPGEPASTANAWNANLELDPLTTAALSTQWTRATHASHGGASRPPVRIDRCGYNAGAFPTSTADVQTGDGCVVIRSIAVGNAEGAATPSPKETPAVAAEPVPGAPPVLPTASPPAPAPSVLPGVSPRPRLFPRLPGRHSTEKPK